MVRSAEGDDAILAKYANELAASVDIILAFASGSLVAARGRRKRFPLSRWILNPILSQAERRKSLNRPGGNVTGIFLDAPEIAGKWIQLLRRWCPN